VTSFGAVLARPVARAGTAVVTLAFQGGITLVVLAVVGIVAGTAMDLSTDAGVWLFTTVPHAGLLAAVSTVIAIGLGLPFRLPIGGERWRSVRVPLVWSLLAGGLLIVFLTIGLDWFSPLKLSADNDGSILLEPLLALGWCLAAAGLANAPYFGSDIRWASRRMGGLLRETGVLLLQVGVSTPIVYLVVSVNLCLIALQAYDGLLTFLAIGLACVVVPGLVLVSAFVFGLPLRLVPPLARWWARYGEISLAGIGVSAIAIVVAWLIGGSYLDNFEGQSFYDYLPDYSLLFAGLAGLAFFSVNARIPVGRWRESLVRQLPISR
jgi:hypothetical protein